MNPVTSPNEEAIRAWDGPLFETFLEFREEIVTSLAVHGETALQLYPPAPGERVLDVGCGFGDSTGRIAELVGPEGEAVGMDAAPRFIEHARLENPGLRFLVADLQTDAELGGPYDAAFSRFGTMFFANPVVALRNLRAALKPGGRMTMVVWRRKLDNEWTYRAELIVKGYLGDKPEDSDEPTCGPGPFSMANADTVCEVLEHAGFEGIRLHREDFDMVMSSLDRAVALVMAIGPGAEVLRLLGDRADHARPQIEADVRSAMEDFRQPGGELKMPSSVWVVSATAACP